MSESFIYNGKTVDVLWHDLADKQVPDLPWQQVYVVGLLNGQVPLVQYKVDHDNLPGGKIEPDEKFEEAMNREMLEELNCRVLSWEPIGYQENIVDGVFENYQLRLFAELKKVGEFVSDPAGSVIGYRLVPINELGNELGWGERGYLFQDYLMRKMSKKS